MTLPRTSGTSERSRRRCDCRPGSASWIRLRPEHGRRLIDAHHSDPRRLHAAARAHRGFANSDCVGAHFLRDGESVPAVGEHALPVGPDRDLDGGPPQRCKRRVSVGELFAGVVERLGPHPGAQVVEISVAQDGGVCSAGQEFSVCRGCPLGCRRLGPGSSWRRRRRQWPRGRRWPGSWRYRRRRTWRPRLDLRGLPYRHRTRRHRLGPGLWLRWRTRRRRYLDSLGFTPLGRSFRCPPEFIPSEDLLLASAAGMHMPGDAPPERLRYQDDGSVRLRAGLARALVERCVPDLVELGGQLWVAGNRLL